MPGQERIARATRSGVNTSQLASAAPSLRIDLGQAHRIGPGKIGLLEAVGRTGSISAAGRELGMSYRRAWLLIDAVNKLFKRPVVATSTGGSHGGGAELTELGANLISAYRRIEARTQLAIREELAPFEADLADGNDEAVTPSA